MGLQLVTVTVDIYNFPVLDQIHRSDVSQLTIGDLHGNAIKLLYFLLKQGVVNNITEKDYIELVGIYRKDIFSIEKKDLALFNKIIDKLKCKKIGVLRLLGDEFAGDRGSNDYFTLKILEKLHEQSVQVEILLSNHGIEFIEGYEKKKFLPSEIPYRAPYFQSVSMLNLEILIQKGFVSRKEVISIYNKAYKPSLRVISYSLTEGVNPGITLYSHAPIGLDTIKNFARKFKIIFKSKTAPQLAATIEKINAKFQTFVISNTIHKLFKWNRNGDPFECLTWNREYENLNRPAEITGFSLCFVHGHDSNEHSENNIFNLDNFLGKGEQENKGEYTILFSHEVPLSELLHKLNSRKSIVWKDLDRKELNFCTRKPNPFTLFANKQPLPILLQTKALTFDRRNALSNKVIKRPGFDYTAADSVFISIFFGFLIWQWINLLGKFIRHLENRVSNLLSESSDTNKAIVVDTDTHTAFRQAKP
ncbi:MAG: hypothetical protein O7C59_03970 [Rickettsia endosymbiont of Ixodes persulcatus]|nr:hypothetical protein [Rickettsia endosymbiont of Ixodes persulcatus]